MPVEFGAVFQLRLGNRSARRRNPSRGSGRSRRNVRAKNRTDRSADGRRRTPPRWHASRQAAGPTGRRCPLPLRESSAHSAAGAAFFRPSSVSETQLPRSVGLVRDAPDSLACTLASPRIPPRPYLLHAIDSPPLRPGDVGNSVMLRQRFVEKRVVGVENSRQRPIALEQVLEEQDRFFVDRRAQ